MRTTMHFRQIALLIVVAVIGLVSAGHAEASERVAIIHVHPSDADPATTWKMADLKAHFNGPIEKFWAELSHGAYDPQFAFFDYPMPYTRAQIKGTGKHYVIDAITTLIPDFKIAGYDPTAYSMTHILLSGSGVGYGGGMGSRALQVNGTKYPAAKVGSFTYLYEPDSYLLFYATPAGQPFKGKADGDGISYPELGLLFEDGTLLHEWGHGLGLSSHANGWYSSEEPLAGALYYWRKRTFWKQAGNYGNWFDTMGRGEYSLHFTAFYQDLLGWLKPGERRDIASTTRDIHLDPLEVKKVGATRAVHIPIADGALVRPKPFNSSLDYAFYVEYRQAYGFDKHLGHPDMVSNTEGLMVTLSRRQGDRYPMSWLLDMSPDGVAYRTKDLVINDENVITKGDYVPSFQHTTLNRGRTFYDEETRVLLTNVRADGMNGVTFDVIREPVRGLSSGVHQTALLSGEKLAQGKRLYSPELSHYIVLQADGNFVVYRSADDRFVWGTFNNADAAMGRGAQHVEVVDGNARLIRGGNVIWQTNTSGHADGGLTLNERGEVLVVDAKGKTLWSSAHDGVQPTSEVGPLREGMKMVANERLYSSDRRVYLVLQFDGNLVLYRSKDDRFLWGSYNNVGAPLGSGSQHVEIVEGDVRLIRQGSVVWRTGTGGHPGATLVVGGEPGLSVQAADGSVIWAP